MPRTFQNGRVSRRPYARLTALITLPIAPLAAHTAPSAAEQDRQHPRPALRVSLQPLDEMDHAVRRDRPEERLHLVEEVQHAEQPEQERDRGEEREQRAVGHLLRKPHAVVRQEPRERPLEDRDPLAAREPLRPTRCVPDVRQLSRGRGATSGRREAFSCPSRPRRAK